MFWSDAYNNRYIFAVNTGEYYGDKWFFFINFARDDFLPRAYLNSSITPLFIELQGIANLGQGVIYTNVYWLKSYPVLDDPALLSSSQLSRLKQAFDQISKRDIKSIFEELGLPKPNKDYSTIDARDISLDKVLRDRKELDRAVVELVKNRLVKAGSV